MTNQQKNVFISHIHEDDSGLDNLKSLLNKNGLTANDYSITSDKENNAKSENYIKSEILAPRINACSAMVVYITPETKGSKWVNWEIEYAAKQDKTIVGVWEEGSKGCELPSALEELNDAIVGWTGNLIVSAINGEYEGCTDPCGNPVNIPVPIKRHPC